ncbi:MAG: hypothetical protein P8172_17360 [Gammaproteobacteria bacterium]
MSDVPHSDWLLLVGIILILAIVVFGFRALRRSSRAKMRRLKKRVQGHRREYERAVAACRSAQARLEKLHARADRVKPRKLAEAENELGDRKREARNISENLRMAELELRQFIEAEYPRHKSARLLDRNFPGD